MSGLGDGRTAENRGANVHSNERGRPRLLRKFETSWTLAASVEPHPELGYKAYQSKLWFLHRAFFLQLTKNRNNNGAHGHSRRPDVNGLRDSETTYPDQDAKPRSTFVSKTWGNRA